MTMTTKKLAILAKCFAGEIDSAINNRITPIAQIGENKDVRELLAEGMILEAEHNLGGRFPMRIKGYVLTLLGHMTYCQSCKETDVIHSACR